jgi:hypothetical protein
MRILNLLVLLLQLQLQPQVPLQPAAVNGVVIDAQTKQPLAGATITLQDRSGSGNKMITVTGRDGKFALHSVPPGGYTIEATRSGYVPEMVRASSGTQISPGLLLPNNIPLLQELAPGQVLSGIQLSLTPGAVITGRLTDDRGEVVVGAVVQALKITHKDGMRERTMVQAVVSNDLGEYRFFMLKPGKYSIAVIPPTVSGPSLIPITSVQQFSIPMFYPGTIDVKAAATLELGVGQTIERVDFSSLPTRTRRISGTVQGNGTEGVTIVLSPANGTARKTATVRSDVPNPNFQFSDIIPGTYSLVASNVFGRAAMSIDVGNSDVVGTRIYLGEGFRIPARVRIEGRPNDPAVENLYFTVRPDVPVQGLDPQLYSPLADGRFIPELLTGGYWIDITRSEGYYTKSITLDGVDVLNQGLHVTASADGPIEVVVDTHFGAVQGAAVAGNATVVLVPDAARRNQRPLYKSVKSSNGVFLFEKVPPGDYKLFAWSEDSIDNGGPWLDPEYLRQYEDRATPVRIQGEMKTVVDRPIPVF